MPALSYGTGGCTSCRAGVPAPAPVAPNAAAVAAAAAANLYAKTGLPWWVWVLGLLAAASFFKSRR